MVRFASRLFIVLTLLAVGGLTALTPARAQAGVFNPVTFTLDNGMEVVVLPNHRAPVVLHMVWYRAGSIDEPEGRTGIAHLLEHLMFKGTEDNPDGAFSQTVAKHGGQENAFTTLDYTGYHQTVAADNLEMVMRLEADRMTNLVLDPTDVKTERDVVLEERNQRIENNPSARLRVEANKKLYPPGHPYGRPIIGWRNELANLTRADAMAYYKDHYAPDNAILVVAGDVDPQEVKRLAEKYYAPIPPAHASPRQSLDFAGPVEGGEVVLKDPRVRQPSWSELVVQPSYATTEPARVAALEVLSEILGGGATSRLYRKLVIEDALAVAAGAYYDGTAAGPGRFALYASPRPGVDLDTVAQAVHAEVRRLLDEGLDEGELARIKNRMLSSAIFARDDMKTGAWTIGSALASGLDVGVVENWPANIEAVSEQDVIAALKAVMDEPRRVTARLMEGDPQATEGGS